MAGRQGSPRKGTGKLPEVGSSIARPKTGSNAAMPTASTPRNVQSSLPKALQGSASSASIPQRDYEESFEDMVCQMTSKLVSPSMSREHLPFESYPDFSEHNKDLHENYKHNTFGPNVPGFSKGLFKPKVNTTSDKKWARLEGVTMNDLLWVCDQTFIKTAKHLAVTLNKSLEAEMAKAVETLRNEVTGPITDSCSTMNTHILALPTTLDPSVQQSVRQSIGQDLIMQEEVAKQTYGKIVEQHADTVQNFEEKKLLHQQTQSLSNEIIEQVQKLAGTVTELGERAEERQRQTMQTLEGLQGSLQEEDRQFESLKTELQEVRQQVQVGIVQAQSKAQQAAERGSEGVLEELGQIRENMAHSLEGKLQQVTDDLKSALAEQRRAEKFAENVEQTACQTDPPETSEVWVQTGDELLKTKKKAKSRKSPSRTTTITKDDRVSNTKTHATVFADERIMKQKAKDALMKKAYNVHDLYHTTGYMQLIAKSRWFETLTYLVIAASALWIAIDLDHNNADIFIESAPGFIVAECLFSTFYILEWVIRFAAFRRKRDACRDAWFVFDTFLVFSMTFETWGISLVYAIIADDKSGTTFGVDPSMLQVLRLAKLLRLTRVTRLLRVVPEFLIVLRAITAAMRSIAVIGFFCAANLYVFAIVMRQADAAGRGSGQHQAIVKYNQAMTRRQDQIDFSSVTAGMNTLLYQSLFRDSAGLIIGFGEVGPIFWLMAVVFVVLVSMTLMYMLVGVMVNVISIVASTEREAMTVGLVAATLRDTLTESQEEAEQLTFTRDEFKELCVNPDVVHLLHKVEVDVYALIDMADQIYDDILEKEGRSMVFSDLVDIVLGMRGHNLATVKDLKSSIRAMKAWFKAQTEIMIKQMRGEMLAIKEGIRHLEEDSDEDEDGEGDESQGLTGNVSRGTAHAKTLMF